LERAGRRSPDRYALKTIADYEIGPGVELSLDRARVDVDRPFVAYFESKLSAEGPTEGDND
jgi:hypothetical protein